MTSRKIAESQLRSIKPGSESYKKLIQVLEYYPDKTEIRYRILINDGSQWPYESEPSYKIKVLSEQDGGLFGEMSATFDESDVPIIDKHLRELGYVTRMAADWYNVEVETAIQTHERELLRIELRRCKVMAMLGQKEKNNA